MSDDARLPPCLVAKLDQSIPELRCVARMLAAFYKELIDGGIPEKRAARMTEAMIWQVTEDLRGGGE